MKKLMIAAAAAAMVGGASAAEPLDAQVYDFTATVKTSECSGKSYTDVCAGKSVLYRIQKTKKLYGKFWGCHCEVIADPGDSSNQGIVCSIGSAQALYGVSRYVDGNGIPTDSPKDANGNDNDIVRKSCIFWMNAKDEDGAFNGADWEWSLLYRLGKKCANIEGMFTLTLYSDVAATTDVATLSGAGYGTCVTTYKNGKNVVCLDESAYILSMSGNIVGTWNVQNEAISSGCAYCGGSDTCEVLPFCDACQFDLTNASAEAVVFGTFTIKYNATESKSVNNGKFIDQLSLSSAKNKAATAVFANVKKAAEEASKGVTPTPEEEKEDALKKAYTTAKTNYETAKATAEASAKTAEEAQKAADEAVATKADLAKGATGCTKGQELAQDVTDAHKEQNDAYIALVADARTYGKAVIAYNKAVEAYNTIKDDATKTNAEIAKAAKAVEDAKTAMDNAKKADSLTANDIKAAEAWVKLADELDAANDAVTEWKATGFAAAQAKAEQDVEDTAKAAEEAQKTADADAEAAEKAETALNNADIACRVANVDCE